MEPPSNHSQVSIDVEPFLCVAAKIKNSNILLVYELCIHVRIIVRNILCLRVHTQIVDIYAYLLGVNK